MAVSRPTGSSLLPFALIMTLTGLARRGRIFGRMIFLCLLISFYDRAMADDASELFVEPMKNQTVEVGQTAVFTCLRSRTDGLKEWRHHSDTLYFINTPRFSRKEGPNGQMELTITNVTADDEGSVDCIVNVKPGGINDGWVANSAYLNVLVPPSDISISVHGQSVTGTILFRQDEMVNLTCTVPDGRPSPKLTWYRGSSQIYADNGGYAVGETRDNSLTSSSLLFRAKPEDNDADFTCQAATPALRQPIAASVKLDVHYPPAQPKILGFTDVAKVRAGDNSFRLVCTSAGGNPPPVLTWFREGVAVESSGPPPVPGSSRRDVSTVLQFPPRDIDNGAKFRCEAVNELMPRGTSVETKLVVYFGPQSVTLFTPPDPLPDKALEINCTTGGSNPASQITWTINNDRRYQEKSSHTSRTGNGAYVTTSTIRIKSPGHTDLSVTCQAMNPETHETSKSNTIIPLSSKSFPAQPGSIPNNILVTDSDGNTILPFNATDADTVVPASNRPDLTMVIAVSVCVGGLVFFTLLGCLIYVIVRGKTKKFDEMAASDSSTSSKNHHDMGSQNGNDTGTDTTGSDVEKTPIDSYHSPKSQLSPSAIRTNAASTYLLDDTYHSPYATYKHWTAPEPGNHDLETEIGVDYEAEDFYVENLRRTARQAMQPHAHSPSPLRPIPPHLTYEPIHKTSMLSTFHGQSIPVYRAEALVDELKGHLV